MKVLYVASECVPFSKTGGLADVVGALPKEIARAGVDARVITPLYSVVPMEYRAKMEHCLFFYVNLGWRRQYVGIEKLALDGVVYYFVDNEYYFGRSYIYGLGGDEGERFAFFCRAVLEALPQIGFMPDVLHLNDWQTGLIPAMLEVQYRVLPPYQNLKTVFTVHNLQYQGVFPIDQIEGLVSLGADAYTSEHMEFYGQCSFMKGGLTYAQKITTVSPSYAAEIQTAYYGERLDGLLRARAHDLVGVLNGIDTAIYNPETDPLIEQNYTADDPSGKEENKRALRRELGLNETNAPLIGMVGRLSGQKGLDLVERVLGEIMRTGAQLVVLGMGEDKYVDLFSWAQWKYAGQMAACIEMNNVLAHRIYAASDLFLMPSMFEPCGLSQMIALRYGSIPVVRETGGLRDTVLSYNEFTGEGNGFTFFNYNAHDMLSVIGRATEFYRDRPDIWRELMRRAMTGRYGWDQSARKYVDLYALLAGEKNAAAAPDPEDAPEVRASADAEGCAACSDPDAKGGALCSNPDAKGGALCPDPDAKGGALCPDPDAKGGAGRGNDEAAARVAPEKKPVKAPRKPRAKKPSLNA